MKTITVKRLIKHLKKLPQDAGICYLKGKNADGSLILGTIGAIAGTEDDRLMLIIDRNMALNINGTFDLNG